MFKIAAVAPITTCVVGIVTIIICFAVSQSLHHDTGGLQIPYISDTGRDKPDILTLP
jgi:hypothetical protein